MYKKLLLPLLLILIVGCRTQKVNIKTIEIKEWWQSDTGKLYANEYNKFKKIAEESFGIMPLKWRIDFHNKEVASWLDSTYSFGTGMMILFESSYADSLSRQLLKTIK